MANYRYKAINANGKYITGKLVADNPSDLSAMLRNDNLEMVSFKEESQKPSLFGGGKIKTKDLISMFVHLEQMDRAGVQITVSVNDIKDNADSPKIRSLMHEVSESLTKGSLFSQSLAKHPEIFSSVYIGLMSMGEKTGNLANSFASIIDDLKWNMDIKRKTKKATTGPLFGLVMMFLVLGLMTTVVVPKVTGFLLAQDIALPMATTSLIKFSNFFRDYWYVIVLAIPALIVTLKIANRSESIAIKIDVLKLKIPIFGKIINKIDAAKFCQFFGMTFKNGLGVLESLDSASSVIKNRAMKHSIVIARQQISDGQSLGKAIQMTGYFPNLVTQMFKIGEETGNMEGALKNINYFYEREINDSIDKVVGMIQPTLTIIMGGMIVWIIIAVFGPIYGSFSQVG
jgi:type IV pilus assembly protein PilC